MYLWALALPSTRPLHQKTYSLGLPTMLRIQVFVRPWKLVRILDFLSFLYLVDVWSRLWHKHTLSVTDSFSFLLSENGWCLKIDEVCSNGLSWLQLIHWLQSMGPLRVRQTEQLHFHFSPSCIGEGNGNPLQYSCLEDPRDGGTCWAAVNGVAQSWTWLKQLSGSSSSSY